MAAVTRQPLGAVTGARLHSLTNTKNTQNGATTTPSSKRKAADFDLFSDAENVEPQPSKKSKASDPSAPKSSSAFTFTVKSGRSSELPFNTPLSARATKTPASKLNTTVSRTPLSTPAGRSPTRGKRAAGILSSRRSGSYARVDPPVFGSAKPSTRPFSLDAALKATMASPSAKSAAPPVSDLLQSPAMKKSWTFEIHEDTPEQEMTNILEHTTGTLDISSDEESEKRLAKQLAEEKENMPPPGDVSQTSTRTRGAARRAAAELKEKVAEKKDKEVERSPLQDLDVRDYYPEGQDESSVVIVPGDEDCAE